ncbi:MAG: hypothetical protein GWM90_09875 [Gemmatimonadetes bacterium]|nr:hypothetical protein [Gemmatimonadota bacterium]NIQ54223.1 hypothetical protein [Gemmatimonadota bacterium]NIU74431.1 hypothetical protein [Gammaproteobacteria bacterium]NIX44411.1 hypothetical protein [Gemmatimonadota bacterium]NIY08633.1 hypothetical protein [Gemmatimonadota bacterium]
MEFRHLLLRLSPRLDGRWLLGLLLVGALVAAASFIRWSGPAPPLHLLALGPEGQFRDTLRVPASWGDTAVTTAGAEVRVPLILGVRNAGTRPVRPATLSLSVPLRYRLLAAGGEELTVRSVPGSPLVTYILETGLGPVEPQRLPTLLPAHDSVWLEVVIPSYYCVALADSIPEFVPAPPPPLRTLSDVRLFYSFEGGDLGERRTGTLTVLMDTTLVDVSMPDPPPSFPMEIGPAAGPPLGALRYAGSRRTMCGEPESPMELLSTVWETAEGGRFITLDYGGKVRKHLFDLDRDGVIERESWDPDGDGTFEATRRARLELPGFLLPASPAGRYDMARFDTLPNDSLARLDPFRRAMPGPGPVPAAVPDSVPARAPARTGLPSMDSLPQPRIRPTAPLGRPVPRDTTPRPPPDTGGG